MFLKKIPPQLLLSLSLNKISKRKEKRNLGKSENNSSAQSTILVIYRGQLLKNPHPAAQVHCSSVTSVLAAPSCCIAAPSCSDLDICLYATDLAAPSCSKPHLAAPLCLPLSSAPSLQLMPKSSHLFHPFIIQLQTSHSFQTSIHTPSHLYEMN